MANTYYTSLSGMLAASYGLQNTSNNVSNMQTPGFKRTDVFYSSLGYNDGNLLGSGVQLKGSTTNFSEGRCIGTENSSNLAIVGNGFFVIKLKNNEFVYTRNGQFDFDNKGVLRDGRTGGEVQGYDRMGNLVAIHQQGPKHAPGKPSRELCLQGDFVYREKEVDATDPSPQKSKYENVSFEAQVYDKQGKSHTVRFEFESTLDSKDNWQLVNVRWDGSDDRISYATEQSIIFSDYSSSPSSSNNSIKFTIDGDQVIKLNFGSSEDSQDKSVQLQKYDQALHPQTTIKVLQNDGYGIGTQLGCYFTEDGQIIYKYDNGQEINGVYVGLARFDNPENQLITMHDSLFRATDNCPVHFGRANQDGFGAIRPRQIETSNVDSTLEFANIVVLQRMFQACSQIMNIDKQLLEELEGALMKPYRLINSVELAQFNTRFSKALEYWNQHYSLNPLTLKVCLPQKEHLNTAAYLIEDSEGQPLACISADVHQVINHVLFGEVHECFNSCSEELLMLLISQLLDTDSCSLTPIKQEIDWLYAGSTCLLLNLHSHSSSLSILLNPNWIRQNAPLNTKEKHTITPLEEVLATESVPLNLELSSMSIPLKQLMDLQVGDVLATDHLQAIPMQLLYGKKPFATAELGRNQENKSIIVKEFL